MKEYICKWYENETCKEVCTYCSPLIIENNIRKKASELEEKKLLKEEEKQWKE